MPVCVRRNLGKGRRSVHGVAGRPLSSTTSATPSTRCAEFASVGVSMFNAFDVCELESSHVPGGDGCTTSSGMPGLNVPPALADGCHWHECSGPRSEENPQCIHDVVCSAPL
jgi:hypothetical protein